ncbi:uncharacterized protein TNCV_2332881 [Trichonephila clavipes]|nr:uncharacterized protein TNCV_2332881 [Trichonephila clavipes]
MAALVSEYTLEFFTLLNARGKKELIEWCMKEGLIASSYECPKCNEQMGLNERKSVVLDGFEWRCRKKKNNKKHPRTIVKAKSLGLNLVRDYSTVKTIDSDSQRLIIEETNYSCEVLQRIVPTLTMAHHFTRQDQTLLARFRSGHIKSMKFSEGRKSFEMCTNCSSESATPAHFLECLGLTKQDLADVPLLVLDFLKVCDVIYLV